MKRQWCALALALCAFGQAASAEVKVEVNGEKIDTDAVIIDDRTYVPLRGVLEKTGAQVDWDGESRTVSVTSASQSGDDAIPGIIEKVSPSIVGIIGRSDSGIVSGSGIIIKSGGEIVTNAHVVKDMQTILAVTNEGKGYEAKLKYIDTESDIAVIKIKKIGLPEAALSDGKSIIVGKKVIAIGTPISFSLRNSATVGYISGIDRGGGYYKLIQTDAAITHGNSGGALVDMNGEIVGITASGYEGTNTSFAIPVDTVKYVLEQFEKYGRVRRASFLATFGEDWLASIGIPSEAGLTIKTVEKDSPLVQADIKSGDVLMTIADTPVNSLVELNEKLKEYAPGDRVRVGVAKDGKIIYADIVLAEAPEKNK